MPPRKKYMMNKNILRRSGLTSLSNSPTKSSYGFSKKDRFGYQQIPKYFKRKSRRKKPEIFSYDFHSVYNNGSMGTPDAALY